ncbi:MAG TPA: HPr-rel-A system PqqD family peptide chaperone [Thermoanaerobaculia bacterium]
MYRLIDYGAMLRDRARIEAYQRALSAVVTPSTVLIDVGSGIGTFSVLAAKLGAARVYGIEPADVITLAEELARANGVADRIQFIQAKAGEAELPERADVIVSDLAGALPLFDEHLPSIVALRERFLAPGGVLIPRSARLFCAPVSSESIYAGIVEPWHALPGVDFTAAETMALQTPYPRLVKPEDLAGEPRVWAELDYMTLTSPNIAGSAEWQVDRTVHAIALWFENTMHGDVRTGSGPFTAGSVHATLVLPLLEPLRPGRLRVELESTLAGGRYVTTWHARTDEQAGARQSTFLSEPRSRASLNERIPVTAPGVPESARFRAADRVLARRVAQELLLLDPATGVYHVLNETGALVWESLREGGQVNAIAAEVASRYDVDPALVTGDVAAIVAELREAKLIEALP